MTKEGEVGLPALPLEEYFFIFFLFRIFESIKTLITYFLFDLKQFKHIGPDLLARVIVATTCFLDSQLIHLSIVCERSYGLKAL